MDFSLWVIIFELVFYFLVSWARLLPNQHWTRTEGGELRPWEWECRLWLRTRGNSASGNIQISMRHYNPTQWACMQYRQLPCFFCCCNMIIISTLKYVLHDPFWGKILRSDVILFYCYTNIIFNVNKTGVYIYEYDYVPYVVSINVTVYGTAPLSKIAAWL